MSQISQGHCVAFTKARVICGRRGAMIDEQRGGPVCLIHAPAEIKSVAYHEAGHQVANYALGRLVGAVSIREDGDAAGWAVSYYSPEILNIFIGALGTDVVQRAVNGNEPALQTMRACKEELLSRDPKSRQVFARADYAAAVAVIAGPRAQCRAIRWGVYATCGCGSDYKLVEEMFALGVRPEGEAKQIRRGLVDDANHVLDEEWPAVRRLASALLENTDLDPVGVGEVLTGWFRRIPRAVRKMGAQTEVAADVTPEQGQR